MKRLVQFCGCCALLAVSVSAIGDPDNKAVESPGSDDAVRLDVVVDAPSKTVFDLWTTAEGVKRYWVADALIDPEVGGRYELLFRLSDNPESPHVFMYGTKILRFEPGRSLSFQLGLFEWSESDRVLKERREFSGTWVELRFDPVENEPERTRVRLTHQGLDKGPATKGQRSYLRLLWRKVLGDLKQYCDGLPMTGAAGDLPDEAMSRWAVGRSGAPATCCVCDFVPDFSGSINEGAHDVFDQQHERYVDELTKRGCMVAEGPLTDVGGALLVLRAESLDAARATAESHPLVKSGVWKAMVHEWRVTRLNVTELAKVSNTGA